MGELVRVTPEVEEIYETILQHIQEQFMARRILDIR